LLSLQDKKRPEAGEEIGGAQGMNFYITICLLVVFGLAVWWLYLIISGLENGDEDGNDANLNANSSLPVSPAERDNRALSCWRAGKWLRRLLSSICFWRDQENR